MTRTIRQVWCRHNPNRGIRHLSYTTFAYANLEIDGEPFAVSELDSDRTVRVSVDVTNTGTRASDEVAQLYVADLEASVPVPLRHLEGFKRLHLAPGETASVHFQLKAAQLACWDDDGSPFLEPGTVRISVGGGQPDDPHGTSVSVETTLVSPAA